MIMSWSRSNDGQNCKFLIADDDIDEGNDFEF